MTGPSCCRRILRVGFITETYGAGVRDENICATRGIASCVPCVATCKRPGS
jgi:hypothetical protein